MPHPDYPDSGTCETCKRGDMIPYDNFSHVKVMAVADGYAMVRRPRCMPFCISVKNLIEKSGEYAPKQTTGEG
jgi:hypothetical protein